MSAFIGVDVGGTNTDAAAIDADDRSVIAGVKTPTTGDVAGGVVGAIRALLDTGAVSPTDVDAVMIGTTHFVNALVEASELQPTAVVRVCGPATRSLPPLVDWPESLSSLVGAQVHLVAGGTEFVGGIALITGLFARTLSVPLAFTMLVGAFTAHSGFDATQGGMEYPLTLAVLSIAIALAGPGRFAFAGGRVDLLPGVRPVVSA